MESFAGQGHPDKSIRDNKDTDPPVHLDGPGDDSEQVYGAVIVGAGQAGLSTAYRLQALNVPYLVLERNKEIGDVWRNRYDSLKWHTSKYYGNLPGDSQTYAEADEYMLPAKRIGAGHQLWAKAHGINAWTSTDVRTAKYDEALAGWTIVTTTPAGDRIIKAKNLVLCIGPGHATPISPDWAADDKVKASGFEGTLIHGSKYKSSLPWAGKRGIVIGTANTAHDVAEDMVTVSYTHLTLPTKRIV